MRPDERPHPFSNPDRISGAALTVAGALAALEASRLPFGSVSAPDAGFFPLCLSVLLCLFGVAVVIGSFHNVPATLDFNGQIRQVLIAAAAFLLYAFLVEAVGYLVSTALVLLLLTRGLGDMSWRKSLIVSIPSVLLSYLGFVKLGVPLPRGIIPF